MFKIIKKFVYKGEFLELNLEDEINKQKNKRLIFLYILFKKILRNKGKLNLYSIKILIFNLLNSKWIN